MKITKNILDSKVSITSISATGTITLALQFLQVKKQKQIYVTNLI